VRGKANASDLALADGSATNAPNAPASVGAAVALNVGTTDNHATVAGANVTGDGVTVEAVMLDNTAGLTASKAQTVSTGDSSIFVGDSAGLRTGDAVTYSNGGGTSIAPLDGSGGTTYYVIDLGGGKVQLAASL